MTTEILNKKHKLSLGGFVNDVYTGFKYKMIKPNEFDQIVKE